MNEENLRDPEGYAIKYADDSESFDVFRLSDEERVGNYPTRRAAVDAARADVAEQVASDA